MVVVLCLADLNGKDSSAMVDESVSKGDLYHEEQSSSPTTIALITLVPIVFVVVATVGGYFAMSGRIWFLVILQGRRAKSRTSLSIF